MASIRRRAMPGINEDAVKPAVGTTLDAISESGAKPSAAKTVDGYAAAKRFEKLRGHQMSMGPGGPRKASQYAPTLSDKLTWDVTKMKVWYDVVVIGTGYGGGISASRLSRAGKEVCVLERGKEYLAGQFPETIANLMQEAQVYTPFGLIGRPNRLFDLKAYSDMQILTGCGLGGGSLINANVCARVQDDVITEKNGWPKELADVFTSNEPGGIEFGYNTAEKMLDSAVYPGPAGGYPELNKKAALKKVAQGINAEYIDLRLAVTWKDGINQAGRYQPKCTNCGNCFSGCNVGAKNTVYMNYIADARAHGAEIFTEVEVDHIRKEPDGTWTVLFKLHKDGMGAGASRFGDASKLQYVRARNVVCSAGSLGTTAIMLRSAKMGLSLSPMVGKRFSGNGNFSGMSLGAPWPGEDVECLGVEMKERKEDKGAPTVGPTIVGGVRVTRSESGRAIRPIMVEDASIPAPLVYSSMYATALYMYVSRWMGGIIGIPGFTQLYNLISYLLTPIMMVAAGGYKKGSVASKTLFMLSCGHDDAEGKIVLDERNMPKVIWPGVGLTETPQNQVGALKRASQALGGIFIIPPWYNAAMGNRLIVVHPLGGCATAVDASLGVADPRGRVFSGVAGTAVHKGLYIADGSLSASSLGTNPFLTICALSERMVYYMVTKDLGLPATNLYAQRSRYDLEDMKTTASKRYYVTKNATVKLPANAVLKNKIGMPLLDYSQVNKRTLGVQFTERMAGYCAPTDLGASFEDHYKMGKASNSPLEFVVTAVFPNIRSFMEDVQHSGYLVGRVKCPALSAEPLQVERGLVKIFSPHETMDGVKQFWYCMRVVDPISGKRYFFQGYKMVTGARGMLGMWPETTTLYATVHNGPTENSPPLFDGILYINPIDFAKQLMTMTGTGGQSWFKRFMALMMFARFFAGNCIATYMPWLLFLAGKGRKKKV